MSDNIVILGNGYIGSSFPTTYNRITRNANGIKELISFETLEYLIKPYSVVINTIGYTGRPNVDAAEQDKENCFKANVSLPVILNDVCNSLNIKLIHVSSGCIFDKGEFGVEQVPNFGMDSLGASFYSRTKHAGEMALDYSGALIVRPRMPFDGSLSNRNYLYKILKYDSLLEAQNSKTHIPSFVEGILNLACSDDVSQKVYNAVCPQALYTSEIVNIFREEGVYNPNWTLVGNIDDKIIANRSNCVLVPTVNNKHPYFQCKSEAILIRQCIREMREQMIETNQTQYIHG